METIVGKTFNIPEDLTNAVKKFEKEISIAHQSAKVFMKEVEDSKKMLKDIIEENMGIIKGYEYEIDFNTMSVTITKKK